MKTENEYADEIILAQVTSNGQKARMLGNPATKKDKSVDKAQKRSDYYGEDYFNPRSMTGIMCNYGYSRK